MLTFCKQVQSLELGKPNQTNTHWNGSFTGNQAYTYFGKWRSRLEQAGWTLKKTCWIFNKHRVSWWENICKKKCKGFQDAITTQNTVALFKWLFLNLRFIQTQKHQVILKVHEYLRNKAKGWLPQCTRKTKTAE